MVKFYTHTETVRSGCQCQKVAYALGSSDFDKIFDNCFASCSFGMAKDIQD
jgi:hypothetical protein